MANPVVFKPATVDFKADLRRRLQEASDEHAAALLSAYDVLEAAHESGLLDVLRGMIASRDMIVTTLANYASLPEGVTGIRNLLTVAKILSDLDPEVLDRALKAIGHASKEHHRERKAPGLWRLWKRVSSEDGRRGLSYMTLILSGLGRSLKG